MKLTVPTISNEKWTNNFGDIFNFDSILYIIKRKVYGSNGQFYNWTTYHDIFSGMMNLGWRKL